MAKVMISIDDKLLSRVDDVADKNYMSRSGLVSTAVVSYLNQQDCIYAVKDMALTMRKIAEHNEIDESTLAKLQELQAFCNMISR